MSKPTVTRVWIVGLIIMVVGLIIGGISMGLMFAYGGTFVPSVSGRGTDFAPNLDSTFWTTVTFMSLGFLIAAIGGIVQITAWIGALVNTYQLQDKTWFAVLLVGGLIGLAFSLVGFAAMIAYIIAGPDGMPSRAVPPPEMPRQQPTPYAPIG
ncbi:MAG TPA: hypothetical protein VFQ25_00950 [Ktedonobacterales bacterium]|nr:hypothetical protein [Ktedonobacterales bacterium]